MAPIPSSELPGHKLLHDRALLALQRCQETQGVDFKRSAPWASLRWKITETVLGMGNLRDGGIIIVGVAEGEKTWELGGIAEEDLETFDVDTVTDQLNAYISPHVSITLVVLRDNGKKFLIIETLEFRDTPLVCKKNGPNDTGLVEGAVYIRPPGMARTTRITNAQQMHELLDLAAEKRARKILEVSKRVGFVASKADSQKFDEELGGL